MEVLPHDILHYLPEPVRCIVTRAAARQGAGPVEEVRLRVGRGLMWVTGTGDAFLTPDGEVSGGPEAAYRVSQADLERAVELVTRGSLHAFEEELRRGYVTLPGGHRVGLVGRAVLERGSVRTLKWLSGLNLRVSREVPGAADPVLPAILGPGGRPVNAILLSPPRAGKTTVLRDLVRQLSDGRPALGFPGVKVGLVDERSEVAGCYRGVPQRAVGARTDVLDGCPKAEGIMMLLRSMSPQVIATDEIGRPEDTDAVEEALNAGVGVVCTAHGDGPHDLWRRPGLRPLARAGTFDRIIVLGRSRGPGTVEAVLDGSRPGDGVAPAFLQAAGLRQVGPC